ncbi:PREDICTED: serine-protein kinase ATM-like [Priapulus caudatus]|uniref:Serine-protein kinase ATM-like n=1 Tax=Priapulus caudatus TaxID=37621 RepID=A0ABM1EH88_PRICU|nr:PREDICTED: serine-protein kinase ATM-like [Priapulus caudatus]
MLSLCCVNVMVVRGLLMNGALQAGDLSQLELLDYGKELMRVAGCVLMSTDRAASLQQSQQLQLLSILRQMYACSESAGDCAGSVAQLCRSLMPAELLQWLLKQATKLVKQGRAAGAPVATATGRKRSDFDELMELEFNDQAAAGPSQDLSFFFDEDDSMSQSSDMSAVQCSPLSQEGLSEQVMLELDCVRLLARYCACDGGSGGPSSLLLPCDRAVSCQLLRLVMESDVKQRAGLQMLVAVGTGLGSDDHRLSDEDLLSLLRCVSAALRHHARDQVVVITLLDLLTTLLRHAYRDDNDVAFDECRRVGGAALAAFEWRDDAGLPAASKMAAAACLLSLAGSVGDLGSARLAGPGGEAGDECPLLLATCLELLRNDSHKVKMLTADAVKMFFGVDDRTGHYRLTAAEQEQLFVKLCEHLRESLDDVGDYKGVEKRDQLASRVYALVTSLANVATSSPYCEKKAVLALCQVVTDYGVNLDDVREVLRDVAAALGYPSLKCYMQTHLGFLISAWLDEGEKLDSLPYALFECGTLEEFYRQNYQQLVPHLVIHDSFDAVRTLALHVCGGGAVDPALTLLVECFPAVFVHVLPLFAAGGAGGLDDGDPDAEVKVKRAIVAYHKFEEAVTKPVMNQLLTDRLDEVVVCLLMLLDPGSPASSMPHALNPPAFNAYTIKTTLDYLTTYCKAGKTQSCLVMLLTTQQDNIQKVLLALSVAMARAYTLLERRRVLLMYRLFVRLLVRYLSSGLGGAWAFTLRDVVHTVCRHIGDLRLQAEERYTSSPFSPPPTPATCPRPRERALTSCIRREVRAIYFVRRALAVEQKFSY